MKTVFLTILIFSLFSLGYGWQCHVWKNHAMSSLKAVGCTSYYVPKMITGWDYVGSNFSVDCYYCTNFLAQNINEKDLQQIQEENAEQQPEVPCCLYSSKEYYYTKPIMTDALNTKVIPECRSTLYGNQLIGQWLVSSLYNQCYFITGSD
ncbi:hypothetical protein M0813_30025 [Anaeramoeba flamelloides]|uniref:Uncharacterized protein n=1 Tax=Anaeramoeba flamelloides TaxID=1746091 RepID=A0ABQ8XMF5_9EUKA|nr:hypothetical protein M0813_30025 [Anaeramoeba flamelloides]